MTAEYDLLKKGLLICLSGPSGVGKGTIIDALKFRGTRLEHSVSVTTRTPRIGEIEGLSYYFRTVDEFHQMIEQGDILEYDEYCGQLYGTPKGPILERLNAGIDVIMDVTVPGSFETLKNFPTAISIFLLPPSFSELRRRLTGRGTETPEKIEKRMEKAVFEVQQAPKFDYVIINYDIDETAKLINKILDAERHRASRMDGVAEFVLNY